MNKFQLENIIKLNISVKCIEKATKSLKIGISDLEIETKEENCNMADAKYIVLLLLAFHVYMPIPVFSVAPSNKF